jgi:CheY-like chemotaxis protein
MRRQSSRTTRVEGAAAVSLAVMLIAAACNRPIRTTHPGPIRSIQMAEFWIDRPIASRDLFRGPSGGPVPKIDAIYTLLKKDDAGFSPGFELKDAAGTLWNVKIGPEAKPEVVASRLVWAMGYHQLPTYYVPRWKTAGERGAESQSAGRFRARLATYRKIEDWSWHENPFVGTRPYKGLLVLMAMLNNSDLKPEQNAMFEVSGPRGAHRRVFVIMDLGHSFGATGIQNSPRGDATAFEKHGSSSVSPAIASISSIVDCVRSCSIRSPPTMCSGSAAASRVSRTSSGATPSAPPTIIRRSRSASLPRCKKRSGRGCARRRTPQPQRRRHMLVKNTDGVSRSVPRPRMRARPHNHSGRVSIPLPSPDPFLPASSFGGRGEGGFCPAARHGAAAGTDATLRQLAGACVRAHGGAHLLAPCQVGSRMTDSPQCGTPSVVVFEADHDNRHMYKLYLESRGARVQSVTNAADALARLYDALPPDALIFDVVRFDMPIAAFCEAVRQIPGPRPPRLILVTGWLLSPGDQATLKRQGVSIHGKPLSLDALWATLRA